MGIPDGFEKTSAPPKVKVSVPQFTSAFAEHPDPKSGIRAPARMPNPLLVGEASSLASGTCLNATHSDMASSRPDPFVAFKDLSHDKNLNPMRQDLPALMDDTSTSPDVHLRMLLQAPQLESVLLGNEEYTVQDSDLS